MDETLEHAGSMSPPALLRGTPVNRMITAHHNDWPAQSADHTVANRQVFETLANNARIALMSAILYGRDPHHITEAQYKAVARALRQASRDRSRVSGVPPPKAPCEGHSVVVLDYGSCNLRSAQVRCSESVHRVECGCTRGRRGRRRVSGAGRRRFEACMTGPAGASRRARITERYVAAGDRLLGCASA